MAAAAADQVCESCSWEPGSTVFGKLVAGCSTAQGDIRARSSLECCCTSQAAAEQCSKTQSFCLFITNAAVRFARLMARAAECVCRLRHRLPTKLAAHCVSMQQQRLHVFVCSASSDNRLCLGLRARFATQVVAAVGGAGGVRRIPTGPCGTGETTPCVGGHGV